MKLCIGVILVEIFNFKINMYKYMLYTRTCCMEFMYNLPIDEVEIVFQTSIY